MKIELKDVEVLGLSLEVNGKVIASEAAVMKNGKEVHNAHDKSKLLELGAKELLDDMYLQMMIVQSCGGQLGIEMLSQQKAILAFMVAELEKLQPYIQASDALKAKLESGVSAKKLADVKDSKFSRLGLFTPVGHEVPKAVGASVESKAELNRFLARRPH